MGSYFLSDEQKKEMLINEWCRGLERELDLAIVYFNGNRFYGDDGRTIGTWEYSGFEAHPYYEFILRCRDFTSPCKTLGRTLGKTRYSSPVRKNANWNKRRNLVIDPMCFEEANSFASYSVSGHFKWQKDEK